MITTTVQQVVHDETALNCSRIFRQHSKSSTGRWH